jgi:hypothetical protein
MLQAVLTVHPAPHSGGRAAGRRARPRVYAGGRPSTTRASDQNSGYRAEGSPSKIHGYQLQPGGDRAPSLFARARCRPARAPSRRRAGADAPAVGRGRGRRQRPPQGGDSAYCIGPPAWRPLARAPGVRPRYDPAVSAAAQLFSKAAGHIGPHRGPPSSPSCGCPSTPPPRA